MKQHFSTQWKASVQPRKQRKYLANAPVHIRHRMLSANLSKELRKKYGKRSFPVRKGDEVKIMRGEFKKRTGKIEIMDLKKYRLTIEGIQRNKKNGTKIKVYFHPSNLQIKELNLDDRKRKEALERKVIAKKEITEEKPVKKQETTEIKKEISIDKKEIKEIKQEFKIKKTNNKSSLSKDNEKNGKFINKVNGKKGEKHAPKKK